MSRLEAHGEALVGRARLTLEGIKQFFVAVEREQWLAFERCSVPK